MSTYDLWGGLILLPALVMVSIPLLAAAAARETDPRIRTLIVGAFVLKIMATFPRYWMAMVLYDSQADAADYHAAGVALAESIWSGNPTLDTDLLGTSFIETVTGLLYTGIGPTILGGFLVYSWFGFWGLYFFFRAFRIAVPDGDARLYAALMLFLPTLVFWTSSIGKDAFIMLALGLAAYGAARVMTFARGGFVLLVVGLSGAMFVRPHVAVLILGGVAIGYLVRASHPRLGALGPAAKFAGVGALVVAGLALMWTAEYYLQVDTFDPATVNGWLEETGRRTSRGGSSFEVLGGGTLLQYPLAVVTLLFRPFPFEAPNAQALLTSLEGIFLLLLLLRYRRRVLGAFTQVRRVPYIAVCVVSALLLIFAFQEFSNFGIVARQRAQILPFVLALVCVRTQRELAAAASSRTPPGQALTTGSAVVYVGEGPGTNPPKRCR